MPDPIVIVGAGQAGVALAAKLRALGHTGRLILIGDEKVPPYQRPPLSKKYVSGELDVERLLIRSGRTAAGHVGSPLLTRVGAIRRDPRRDRKRGRGGCDHSEQVRGPAVGQA